MKRKLVIGALVGAVILGGAVAVGANDLDDVLLKNTKDMIAVQKDEILEIRDDDNDDSLKQMNSKAVESQKDQKEISQAEAIAIAEKAVNGKVHSIEKEYDDGRIKYEFELSTNKGEVDVEVDALTGEILEMDYDD